MRPHLLGTGYTCPVLMNLMLAWLRLRGRRVRWKISDGVWRVIETRVGLDHGWEITCCFPLWLIRLECRFWDSRPGLAVRCWSRDTA